MKRKFLCSVMVMVSLALLLSNGVLASSFEEQQIAAAYLKERGIMEGDNNGAMNLESSLTRAELAVILAHLNGDPEHLQTEQERYYKYCQFQDVPEWARVYVGYCYANGLMAGYSYKKSAALCCNTLCWDRTFSHRLIYSGTIYQR